MLAHKSLSSHISGPQPGISTYSGLLVRTAGNASLKMPFRYHRRRSAPAPWRDRPGKVSAPELGSAKHRGPGRTKTPQTR